MRTWIERLHGGQLVMVVMVLAVVGAAPIYVGVHTIVPVAQGLASDAGKVATDTTAEFPACGRWRIALCK